jgi:hypothetical protein
MDWGYDSDHEIVRSLKEESFEHNDETKPLIIFGTDAKMISIDPFLGLLSIFRETLRERKLYVIIGYSFFDQYLNNLIIQQLQLDPKKKLLVVDPCFGKKHSKTKAACEEEFLNKIATVQSIVGQHHINLRRISKEKVIVEPLCTGEFYKKYFSKGASKLIEIFQKIDSESRIF